MIPVFKPYMPEGILPQIENILYSGNLAFGKYGRLFEDSLRSFIGNPYTLTVSSYNQAVLVAVSTLGLQPGDQVIASPVSCLASNQPLVTKNLKVVWADVNPHTGSLDPEDVIRKITSKTKAIFHNHFCGFLGEINEINQIARENGLFVVDDCIEAFGSEYKGLKMGNIGSDISLFSFQTIRLPNTIDGGALTFKNKALFEKALQVRDYGIDRETFRDDAGEINPACDISVEGYGALMAEINSYIGVEQMSRLEELLLSQTANATKWDKMISKLEGVTPILKNTDTKPNYWVYGVMCDHKLESMKEFRGKGFYATGVHINNNIYSVFGNSERLKGVDLFMSRFLALPSGWWVNL